MKQVLKLNGEIPIKKNRQRAGVSRSGKAFIYKAKTADAFESQVAKELLGKKQMRGKLFVSVELHCKKDRDLDGAVTSILDALQNGGLFGNDRDVIEQYSKKVKCDPDELPHAIVEITETTV